MKIGLGQAIKKYEMSRSRFPDNYKRHVPFACASPENLEQVTTCLRELLELDQMLLEVKAK